MLPNAKGRQRTADLESRVRVLEASLAQLRKSVGQVQPFPVRFARVTTSGTYPSAPANCYEIVFVDGSYTATAGSQTITWAERSASPQAVACWPGEARFIAEDQVVCVVRQRNRQWMIIAVYPLATWVHFTLPSDLALTDANKASCTVNDYWGGDDPGSSLTVYNPPASSDYLFEGDSGGTGLAVYDDQADKWWIVQLECPA